MCIRDRYLHLFAKEQPDWNWANREIRDDFLETLRFWSDRGVDGFRVDVAHGLAKDLSEPLRNYGGAHPDALTELPLDGSHPLFDREEVHEIFRGWRKVLDSYDPPRSAVAEAPATAAADSALSICTRNCSADHGATRNSKVNAWPSSSGRA